MTNAPKTIGLVHNGCGGWRLWTKDDADDPTVVAVPYILAAEHERLMAERDAEIERLREALTPFAELADHYAGAENDDHVVTWDYIPTLGALRKARAALVGEIGADLVQQLRGRSRFCYSRGEIKSPDLMKDAAARIVALEAELAAARDKALEDAARMVDCACECREAVLTANTKVERWTACGRDPCGALDAAAIRALIDKPGE